MIKKSIVDDEFFKLSEMENFLLAEEKLEATKDKPKSIENDIDMFQDLQSDEEVNFITYKYYIFLLHSNIGLS